MWVCAILYGVGLVSFSAGQCTTLAVLVMSFCLAACEGESSTDESSGGPLAGMVVPTAVTPPSIRGGQVGPVAGDMSVNPQDDDSSAGRVAGRSAAEQDASMLLAGRETIQVDMMVANPMPDSGLADSSVTPMAGAPVVPLMDAQRPDMNLRDAMVVDAEHDMDIQADAGVLDAAQGGADMRDATFVGGQPAIGGSFPDAHLNDGGHTRDAEPLTGGQAQSAGAPSGGRGESAGDPGEPPARCDDQVQNGAESDVDCGPGCTPCVAGAQCSEPDDCRSGVCQAMVCQSPTCEDGRRNGDEVGRDCGGPCGRCPPGETCVEDADCLSVVCVNGVCIPPACDDRRTNGEESDIDCGGGCDACDVDKQCQGADDCLSGVCQDNLCQPATCDDDVLNGTETAKDCGGSCQPCDDNQACAVAGDCASNRCESEICRPPRCDDQVQNGNETDVDCGAGCPRCSVNAVCAVADDCSSGVCSDGICAAPRCDDAVLNGSEVDEDCGGGCPGCATGERCNVASDCASLVCQIDGLCAAPSCDDDILNGSETDRDCGGGCTPCEAAQGCLNDTDCQSGLCDQNACREAACGDSTRNGDESDIDCGGSACAPCAAEKICRNGDDCRSKVCTDERCIAGACDDDVRNQDETDVDCGGGSCAACAPGSACENGADCQSLVCTSEQCQGPTCEDQVRNGAEADVDCGGVCDPCLAGASCQVDDDCLSQVCAGNECQAPSCFDAVANGSETDVDCGGECGGCFDGQACLASTDCGSRVCGEGDDGRFCKPPTCNDGVRNGFEREPDCGGLCDSCSCRAEAVVSLNAPGQINGTTSGKKNYEHAGCGTSGEAPEVVHEVTVPARGVYCASTSGSAFDTILYVRTECSDENSEIACNDAIDYPNEQTSQVEFVADETAPVFVVVDGYSGEHGEAADASGAYTLNITAGRCGGQPLCTADFDCELGFECGPDGLCVKAAIPCARFEDCPPEHFCDGQFCVRAGGGCSDDVQCGPVSRCSDGECKDPPPTGSCAPEAIQSLQVGVPYNGTTLGSPATNEDATCNGGTRFSPEVVHAFRADVPGEHCASITANSFDAVVYVRSGCQQPFGGGCVSAGQNLSFFTGAGTDTFLFVDGIDGGEQPVSGTYTLSVVAGACPDCAVSSDCESGSICKAGRCVAAPAVGAVLITELLVNPPDGLGQDGQWVELQAKGDSAVDLTGCALEQGTETYSLDAVTIPGGDEYLLAGHLDVALNGGVNADSLLGIEIGLEAPLRVRCNDVVVAEVGLNAPRFQSFPDTSFGLSRDLLETDHINDPDAWCAVVEGSPGQPNEVCDRCEYMQCPPAPPNRCDSDFIVRPSMTCATVEGQLAPACTVVNDRGPCDYEGVCRNGVCQRQPVAKDVIFSELMIEPVARTERFGEWIELYNRTDDAMELDRCYIIDGPVENRLSNVRIEPKGFVVIGRSTDQQRNGGVAVAQTTTVGLSNDRDALQLRCGTTVIDQIQYAADDGFSLFPGRSLALNPDHFETGFNQQASAWCNGETAFGGADGDRGTPGQPNDRCGGCNPNPCTQPPANECAGLDVLQFAGPGTCQLIDGAPQCVFASTAMACPTDQVCQEGLCVPDERGCLITPCLDGDVCDVVTATCEAAPGAGTCAAPIVVNWDPSQMPSMRVSGTTSGAGSNLDGASCGGGGIGPENVFTYTAVIDGSICVTTDDATSRFDTLLHLRSACDDSTAELQPPMALGCSDDIGDWDDDGQCDLNDITCAQTSAMTVRLNQGETIFVIVDSDSAEASGEFGLRFSDGPCVNAPPPNQCFLDEQCALDEICFEGICEVPPAEDAACGNDQVVVLDGPGTYEGSTVGQPFGQSTTECGEADQSSEVVHRVRLDRNTRVCVVAEGLDFDPLISVRRGVCTGNEEVCNDDIAPGFDTTARVEFFAVAGSDYFILVDAPNSALSSSGDYRLTVFDGACADMPGPCAATNDCPGTCAEPIVVDAFGEYELETSRAARGIDQAECAPVVGPEAVFELNLGYFGPVCVTTFGSDPTYDLVLHTRALCSDPNEGELCLDREDDGPERLELDLDFNETTYLFVDSWSLTGGRVSLGILPGNCPICDLDSECPNGRRCVDGVCVQCQENVDCEDNLVCEEGSCRFPPCLDDAQCDQASICTDGRCVPGARSSCDERSVVDLVGLGQVNGATTGRLANLNAGCAETSASPEQVHRLRLPADQTVCVETVGSAFDTVAYVRTDCERDQQEPCNDNINGEGAQVSSFTLNALANLDYYLVVDGKDGPNGEASSGPYTLTVSAGACPDCAADAECGVGRVCMDARCVDCRANADCGANQQCDSNRCVDLPDPCDASTPCRTDDLFTGVLGQVCDLTLAAGDQNGLCVDRGMCRQPQPYQIGQRVEDSNVGRSSIYTATCGGRGTGAEVVYAFEAPADGVACFTIVSADYDVVLSLKDFCATNPAQASVGFLACTDVAGVEMEANRNDRLAYALTAGEIYYIFVDANGAESSGDFTLFSHYGQCGAVPPPVCETDDDCRLGEACTPDRQCIARIGTCDDPVSITSYGTYGLAMSTASHSHDSSNEACDACVNPIVGNCGEAVYRFEPQQSGPVCITTEGSSFDTVLYVRTETCEDGVDQCNDDVIEGTPWSALTLNAVLGETYFIFADSWGRSGRLSLNVIDGACP